MYISSSAFSPRSDAAGRTEFSLVLSQINKSRDISYSIRVYATLPFAFTRALRPPDHKVGGNSYTQHTCAFCCLSALVRALA